MSHQIGVGRLEDDSRQPYPTPAGHPFEAEPRRDLELVRAQGRRLGRHLGLHRGGQLLPVPGDQPAPRADAGAWSGEDARAGQALIDKYGLDEPLLQQFLTYMKNLLTLDFGDSTSTASPSTACCSTGCGRPSRWWAPPRSCRSFSVSGSGPWRRGTADTSSTRSPPDDDHVVLDAGVVAGHDPVLGLRHRLRALPRLFPIGRCTRRTSIRRLWTA